MPKRRRTVRVAAGASNAPFRRPGEDNDLGDEEVIDLDENMEDLPNLEPDDDDEAVEEEADASNEAEEDDEGQGAHNEQVAKTLQAKAIHIMETNGIFLDSTEQREALKIFPRVCFQIILHSLFNMSY